MKNKIFDKYQIRNALIAANKKLDDSNKINTKSKYDVWASHMDFMICDELEENGFCDWKFLFNMKDADFLSWIELKKLCKQYQNDNAGMKLSLLYSKMIKENEIVPPITMLNSMYKEYNSMRDIFSIGM